MLPMIIPNSKKINKVLIARPRAFVDAKSIAQANIEGELKPVAMPKMTAERMNREKFCDAQIKIKPISKNKVPIIMTGTLPNRSLSLPPKKRTVNVLKVIQIKNKPLLLR